MALLEADQNKLREEYDGLEQLVIESQQDRWATQKATIIALCIEKEIQLYNIASINLLEASKLLSRLIALSLEYDQLEILDKDNPQWLEKLLEWQKVFNLEQQKAKLILITLHDEAYLSVDDQYKKRGAISEKTLLTMQDMTDLLAAPKFISDDIVKSKPFSLVELSTHEENELRELIAQNQDKTIFLPVNYDGHWFYLIRENGNWKIEDEQPLEQGEELDELFLTSRQKGMLDKSTLLLNNLIGEGLYNELEVYSTQNQFNDFDCGTRVVNAYRTLVDETYEAKDHRDMLVETLGKQLQLPEEQLPEQLFSEDIDFSEKIDQVIEATIADQDSGHEQFENYETFVKSTIHQVLNKRGFFANVQNRIEVEDLENDLDVDLTDKTPDEIKEIDKEFAAALQEAECRKAGLF